MLDWGIFKIDQRLTGPRAEASGWAEYDFDSNVILVQSYSVYERAKREDEGALRTHCDEWMSAMRKSAGVNQDTGEAYGEATIFARLFTHEGYINGDQDANLKRLKDLDKKFRLAFEIRTNYFNAVIRCEAPLLGTGYSVRTQWPDDIRLPQDPSK